MLTEPWKAVEDEGGTPELVSLESGEIQGFDHLDKGAKFEVDRTLGQASESDYDGLDENAVRFVRSFFEAGKPWPSLRTDIRTAGVTTCRPSATSSRRRSARGDTRSRQRARVNSGFCLCGSEYFQGQAGRPKANAPRGGTLQ